MCTPIWMHLQHLNKTLHNGKHAFNAYHHNQVCENCDGVVAACWYKMYGFCISDYLPWRVVVGTVFKALHLGSPV